MPETKNKPDKKFRLGPLSSALFRKQNEEGKTTGYFVVFQKSTLNRETQEYSNEGVALNAVEIPAAILVLQQIENELLRLN